MLKFIAVTLASFVVSGTLETLEFKVVYKPSICSTFCRPAKERLNKGVTCCYEDETLGVVTNCTSSYNALNNDSREIWTSTQCSTRISRKLTGATINEPTFEPTYDPTKHPSPGPSKNPSIPPTVDPTNDPTFEPTYDPTKHPSPSPSDTTVEPSDITSDPTNEPTFEPTYDPTKHPSPGPSKNPSIPPTVNPTDEPTFEPTYDPTKHPSTSPSDITLDPTFQPSDATMEPTNEPTKDPTKNPRIAEPSLTPTISPTDCCERGFVSECCLHKKNFPEEKDNCCALSIQSCRGDSKCKWIDSSNNRFDECNINNNTPSPIVVIPSPTMTDVCVKQTFVNECCVHKRSQPENREFCCLLDTRECNIDNSCRWIDSSHNRFSECNLGNTQTGNPTIIPESNCAKSSQSTECCLHKRSRPENTEHCCVLERQDCRGDGSCTWVEVGHSRFNECTA